jgi:uncharacterized protein (TIGR02145 family)
MKILKISQNILIATILILSGCKQEVIPTITIETNTPTNLTAISGTFGGNVTSADGFTIVKRGVCISTKQNPTLIDGHVISTTPLTSNTFNVQINNLNTNTTYYYRAFVDTQTGTYYGNELTFTTSIMAPVVSTTQISSITGFSAISGGTIVNNGGANVTARGVCWNTSPNPTTQHYKTVNGSGNGTYQSNLTDLLPNTTYYVRAYATNSQGTGYGGEIEFKTTNGYPMVITEYVQSIHITTAICGANVTSDGGLSVTSRGVVWSLNSQPDLTNYYYTGGGITVNDSGTGSYEGLLDNLQPNTTYFVRAYATNSLGTGYGDIIEFKTLPADGTTGSVVDIDGNVYQTVFINGKEWMAQNLKTTRYRNGESIFYPGNDDNAWMDDVSGAYAWYNNDQYGYGNTYGALYNFYAVTNTYQLCPEGWHVPTDYEWFEMEQYIDPSIYFDTWGWRGIDGGHKLKSTSGWYYDGNGTNQYGFNALPAGVRYGDGYFNLMTTNAFFWTSNGGDSEYGFVRQLEYYRYNIYRSQDYAKNGLSVRCVKDSN